LNNPLKYNDPTGWDDNTLSGGGETTEQIIQWCWNQVPKGACGSFTFNNGECTSANIYYVGEYVGDGNGNGAMWARNGYDYYFLSVRSGQKASTIKAKLPTDNISIDVGENPLFVRTGLNGAPDNNYIKFKIFIDTHQFRLGQPTSLDLDLSTVLEILHASTYTVKGFLFLEPGWEGKWNVMVSLNATTTDESNEKDSYFAGIIFGFNGKDYNYPLYKNDGTGEIAGENSIFLGYGDFILPSSGHLDYIQLRAGYYIDEFYGHASPLFYKQTFNFK
jgi:hypothetical protein